MCWTSRNRWPTACPAYAAAWWSARAPWTRSTDAEVAAILSHERAHLRARHDLVLEAFTAAHAAFPRFVRSATRFARGAAAGRAIGRRRRGARRRPHSPGPRPGGLRVRAARRLGALAAGGTAHAAAGAPAVRQRQQPVVLSAAAYLAAAAVFVVPTVALAVPWLTELHRLFNALTRQAGKHLAWRYFADT